MDIAEVRRQFAAYGSGELSEFELRSTIRHALTEQPMLSSAYVALAEAYRRANVIDPELQSIIIADITDVTGPRAPAPAPADEGGRTVLTRGASHPGAAAPGAPRAGIHAAGFTAGSGPAWDSPERMAEAAAPLTIGSVLNERFELVEELGRGGMGVVYKALDWRGGEGGERRYVALKVLNDEFKRHPLAVRSLQREARKAQKLAHPNIVTVYDFDRDGGNVFMVMELLAGRGLDELIRERGRGIPPPRVLEIVKALGAALGYAHQQGIIHCDFKPSNAFITEQGAVKVLDFGIARAAPVRAGHGDKTTFDAGQLGAMSPPYASPEMLNHEEPDVRDDIYALACVAYELFTGRHPFNRIDAAKAQASSLQPPPVRGLSRSQWQALRQGLCFERAGRTPSVEAFVTRLSERGRRTGWWAAAAVLAVIAVALAVIAPGRWEDYQARSLAQALEGSDATAFAGALARLEAAPAGERQRVLLDRATRAALIARFRATIAADVAAPAYDYGRARAALAELQQLLPDSSEVTALGKQLDGGQRAALGARLERRDAFLARGVLVAAQGAENATLEQERIRRIDPGNAALSDPRVAGTYLAAGNAALGAGRAELAREIAVAALGFVPNDARLADLKVRAEAGDAGTPGVPEPQPPAETLALRKELAVALARPQPTAAWAGEVQGLLQKLTPLLPADDPGLADARRAAGATFLKGATSAREHKRYADAGALLATARGFDPNSAGLARESASLAHEHEADTQEQATQQQRTAIDTLKRQLAEQVAAGDLAGANASANSLRRVLGGSVYVARDLPQLLADGYGQLAKAQLGAGHVDAALETLAAGRKKFGSSPQLKSLEARYVAIGDVYDRLSTAVKLGAADQRRAVEALRAGEGADFAAVERMLAKTLANRVADQRAAGRDTVAASLLEAGREIFPEYATVLEQGTAGALPKTGLPVNVDESN